MARFTMACAVEDYASTDTCMSTRLAAHVAARRLTAISGGRLSTWEIIWSVVGTVATLLYGTGFGLVTATPAAFRGARVCFVATGVLVSITAIVWSLRTTAPTLHIWVVDGIIVAALPFLLAAALVWVSSRQRLIPSAIADGVGTHGNSETKEATSLPPVALSQEQLTHQLRVIDSKAINEAIDFVRNRDTSADRAAFQRYAKHPIVELEVISDAGARSVRLFVVNIGDEPAVDVTIAPIGEDSISFVPVRVLRPSDPKTEVQTFFHDAKAQSFTSPFAKGLIVAKMSYKAGWTLGGDGRTRFANYVPVCLTYGDSLGRLYHTHDYVFADVSHHQVVVRHKLDSETVLGASRAHDSHCRDCRDGKPHPELRRLRRSDGS